MSDQVATLLSNVVSVLGTLAGIILGVILTNLSSKKSERARISREKIEEVYGLTLQVNAWANEQEFKRRGQLQYKAGKDTECPIDEISMLVNLYLSSLREHFISYHQHVVLVGEIQNLESQHNGASSEKVLHEVSQGFARSQRLFQDALKELALKE